MFARQTSSSRSSRIASSRPSPRSRSASRSSSPPLPSTPRRPPVGLGTATSFAVLAGAGHHEHRARRRSTVTSEPSRRRPRPASAPSRCNGANNAGNAVTQQAKTDLTTAYNTAAGALPAERGTDRARRQDAHTGRVHVGNARHHRHADAQHARRSRTRCSSSRRRPRSSPRRASQVIVLNGAPGVQRVLAGRRARQRSEPVRTSIGNVSWRMQAITANTGATIQGRLLARNASVTLRHNTITRTVCAATTPVSSTPTTRAPSRRRVVVAPTTVPSGTPTTTPGAAPGAAPAPVVPGTPGAPATPAAPGTPGAPGTPTPPLPRTE